jgi:hypothetical protein
LYGMLTCQQRRCGGKAASCCNQCFIMRLAHQLLLAAARLVAPTTAYPSSSLKTKRTLTVRKLLLSAIYPTRKWCVRSAQSSLGVQRSPLGIRHS